VGVETLILQVETRSIAHIQFLGLGHQLPESLQSLLVVQALVSHQVIQANPMMVSDQAERDFPVLQEPDEVKPGDIQQIGDLLGREFRVERKQRHALALGHLHQDVFQEAKRGHRYGHGLYELAGLGDAVLADDDSVAKVGRTTSTTKGRVTAFELDNVVVGYGIGYLKFDNQVEIEGGDSGPFSQGGDSGSLIVDAGHRAVALLFAGGDLGGSNGLGLTYANSIRAVLEALKVDLFFS
jgi:hypothetical protein